MYDYEGILHDVVLPEVEDAVWTKPLKELTSHFTTDTQRAEGKSINREIFVARTSNVANYDKSDVDPVAGTQTPVTASWNLIYTHTAAEVHGIDKWQAKGASNIADLMQNAVMGESEALWQKIYENIYAQLRADLLNSGTYSDALLNRSTYPVLGLYNEMTDTPITVGLVRGCVYGSRLNKKAAPLASYEMLMEPSVYNTFAPQAQLLNSWVINDATPGGLANVGYQPIGNFEGTRISQCPGMTTGDVFYINRGDIHVNTHRPLELSIVPSGRDSLKIVMRVGINLYVLNVWRQGAMFDKD